MLIDDLLQPTHLLLVLAIVLLIFGPKRIPEVGRALGHSFRGFKASLSDEDDADRR